MKGASSVLTLILASLIITSSMGCFGLVPMRESLELMRGEPIIETIDYKTNISYIKITTHLFVELTVQLDMIILNNN